MTPLNLPAAPRTILLLRTDAIGDNVLASALLAPLRHAFPGARLVIACQERVADLYRACPLITEVVSFDHGRAYADEGYRMEVGGQVAALGAEAALNSMLTREPLSDTLLRDSAAPLRVGFAASSPVVLAPGCADDAYTHLITPRPGWRRELDRAAEFLAGLGLPGDSLNPAVWLTADDMQFAADIFAGYQLDQQNTIVLFAGALASYRVNPHLGAALAAAVPGADIISVGAAHEYALHEQQLASTPLRHINLCGRTTLRQMAALLQRARLAVGAETGAAHLACAVNTPNVIVLGGGHFGRFVPWSPLTTAAALPLQCYRCDWKCRHARAHCVQDITAHTIATAIRTALSGPSENPRIVAQPAARAAVGPAPAKVTEFLNPTTIDIIPCPPAVGAPGQPLIPRATPRKTAPGLPAPFTVTAIVSTYKSERFLKGCLQDLVDQTLFQRGELEILIIDSASPQNEAGIVQDFQQRHGGDRIIYRRTPLRETLYAAWNRAIPLARGKYLTNANTDDRHHPQMLEILAGTLDKHPQHAVAYADSDVTHDANGTWHDAGRVKTLTWPDFSRDQLFAASFTGPHPMWRRTLHDSIGYFDASMTSAGDYEFFLRAALTHSFIHVPRALSLYLENFESISLANGNLAWYETRLARGRYWNPDWGFNPGLRPVAEAFEDLQVRAATLPAGSRFALLGAGQHTQRNLGRFKNALRASGAIVAILDDRAATLTTHAIAGIPILQTDRWRDLDVTAIVVSSDTYEQALVTRAVAAIGSHGLPILTVYKPELGRPAACPTHPVAV